MVRTVVRLHTVVLFAASLAVLVAPGSILTAFGVADLTFPVLALASSVAGGLLTTELVLHSVAFGWLAGGERRSLPAGV